MKALKQKVSIPMFIGITLVLAISVYIVLYYSGLSSSDLSELRNDVKDYTNTALGINGQKCLTFDADMLEDIKPADRMKYVQGCLEYFKSKPNELLTLLDFQLLYHKAGDQIGTYANNYLSGGESNSDCYSVYLVSIIGEGEMFDQNVKAYISYRENKSKYYIEISRFQQEEIWQKLLDDKFFELDNMYSDPILGYFRLDDVSPSIKTPHQDYWLKDFTQITAMEVGAIDDTPKNKLFIENFTKWFKDKYDPLLYANPCKDNLFPYDVDDIVPD